MGMMNKDGLLEELSQKVRARQRQLE
jgi:hypothetical protein